ncbi:MAG TPA: YdeI/OmpD-associated family protein [Longimicrobiales bacterium]|nr:YdeI/OmpD-associated family protein [Longimicrobiales bacterium]
MPPRAPRVDAYIEKARPFAQPILRHLREVIHRAEPRVEETIKWGFPHFEVGGIICSIAAFKAHCALTFWNAEEVLGGPGASGAMGQFGRITTLEDLPDDTILEGYVRTAAALRDAGVTVTRAATAESPPVEVPADLARALEASPAAARTFEEFSPSHRREYVEWITEAKRDATRERRLAQAVAWMAEGKPRNWKYR